MAPCAITASPGVRDQLRAAAPSSSRPGGQVYDVFPYWSAPGLVALHGLAAEPETGARALILRNPVPFVRSATNALGHPRATVSFVDFADHLRLCGLCRRSRDGSLLW